MLFLNITVVEHSFGLILLDLFRYGLSKPVWYSSNFSLWPPSSFSVRLKTVFRNASFLTNYPIFFRNRLTHWFIGRLNRFSAFVHFMDRVLFFIPPGPLYPRPVPPVAQQCGQLLRVFVCVLALNASLQNFLSMVLVSLVRNEFFQYEKWSVWKCIHLGLIVTIILVVNSKISDMSGTYSGNLVGV